MAKRKKQSPIAPRSPAKRRKKVINSSRRHNTPETPIASRLWAVKKSVRSNKRKRSSPLDVIFGTPQTSNKRTMNNQHTTTSLVWPTTLATHTAWTSNRNDYWDRLDQELHLFGQFVQLNPSELQARQQWIQSFRALLLEHDIQVFGSFSNPNVWYV